MAYFGIERKVERALQSLLDAVNLDGVPVYLGSDNNDETEEVEQGMRLPFVVCICDDASSDMPGLMDGVYQARCRVEVNTHRDDEPGSAADARAATVRDTLLTDDLAARLSSSVADFHCFRVLESGLSTDNTQGVTVNTISLTLAVGAFDA
jgi:hypothetical protein